MIQAALGVKETTLSDSIKAINIIDRFSSDTDILKRIQQVEDEPEGRVSLLNFLKERAHELSQ
jgi:hypothetical protein